MKRQSVLTPRQMIRQAGGYLNPAENEASIALRELGVEYTRRGYPDFTLIENDEIIGFVEVKPRESKELRKHQALFQKMCEQHGIPFLKWCPEDGIDALRGMLSSNGSKEQENHS